GPDRLPGTEDFGQIAPGDAGPIPVDDRLDHGPRIGEGPALAACGAGEHVGDHRPLGIREHLEPRQLASLAGRAPPIRQPCPQATTAIGEARAPVPMWMSRPGKVMVMTTPIRDAPSTGYRRDRPPERLRITATATEAAFSWAASGVEATTSSRAIRAA